MRYHAAGAFEQSLKLPSTLAGRLTPATSDRLIAILEAFLRKSHATDPGSRGAHLNELLVWVVSLLRRGEPVNLISIQIKAYLATLFPSLAIGPASSSWLPDASTSVRCFGLDFRSHSALTRSDRRFLRACAQLITLLDTNMGPHTMESTESSNPPEEQASPLIVHTVAEWQAIRSNPTLAIPRRADSRTTFGSLDQTSPRPSATELAGEAWSAWR